MNSHDSYGLQSSSLAVEKKANIFHFCIELLSLQIIGNTVSIPILPASYRCRLRRDISWADNVTVSVVFQSNKNRDSQRAGIKDIQERTFKVKIRKAKHQIGWWQSQGSMQERSPNVQEPMKYTNEIRNER